jgi:hypothetical protein
MPIAAMCIQPPKGSSLKRWSLEVKSMQNLLTVTLLNFICSPDEFVT